VNGTPANDRAVADSQPRAQLRKLFNEGNMDTKKHAFISNILFYLLILKAIRIFTGTFVTNYASFFLKGFLNEPSAIQRCSKEYIANDHLVKTYVATLKICSSRKRNMKNQGNSIKEKKEAKHNDYDWILIYREGRLRKLSLLSCSLPGQTRYHLFKECIETK